MKKNSERTFETPCKVVKRKQEVCLNHTGRQVYKFARVAGHTNKFVFEWFTAILRHA